MDLLRYSGGLATMYTYSLLLLFLCMVFHREKRVSLAEMRQASVKGAA